MLKPSHFSQRQWALFLESTQFPTLGKGFDIWLSHIWLCRKNGILIVNNSGVPRSHIEAGLSRTGTTPNMATGTPLPIAVKG